MHGLVEACRDLPLVVKLMVPSCVPALPFEDEGAFIDAGQTQALLEHPEFFGEMMNVPGILNGNPEACSKVAAAQISTSPSTATRRFARARISKPMPVPASARTMNARRAQSLGNAFHLACTSRSVKARSRETVFP